MRCASSSDSRAALFAGRSTDEEVEPFVELVKSKLAEKHSFEQAVRVGLKAILVSPEFLFLREEAGKLDDFALASRLSYFLWSTMPDDELLVAGREEGSSASPTMLRAQVERMLKHPKARAFTENFTGQWLGLRDIDFTAPDQRLYPEYDALLREAMLRETHLFFDELLKNDLSLTNFVASDFTFLNDRLAKHYGIPGGDGPGVSQGARLPPESHRGGVLTMASVLKVTANGTNTSPVVRGAWVLDRILGNSALAPAAKRAGGRAGHSRRNHHPRAARQAPRNDQLQHLPREDRPAGLRAGELRRHRRLARPTTAVLAAARR